MAVTRIYFVALFYFLLFGSAYGQYAAQFIQPLPQGNPDGITVNTAAWQISVNENRPLDTGDPEVNDIVAKLDYTGTGTPAVSRIIGESPPSLSIVKIENIEGWTDGFYIKLTSALDFEGAVKSWGVELNPAAQFPFAVFAVDINDNAPLFTSIPDTPIPINENEDPTGKTYFKFEATDADALDAGKLRFTLEDLQEIDTPFGIDAVTGELTMTRPLDYESRTTYRLQISVTDSGVTPVKAPIVTVINVADANDQGPRWLKFQYRLDVTENAMDNTWEYQAQDQDLGIKNEIIYTLLEGGPVNGEGIPYLEIDRDSGVLKISAPIDAELNRDLSLDFSVVATETMDPQYNITEAVSLRIIDLNDNSPLIDGQSSIAFPVTILESHREELPSLEAFVVVDSDVTLDYSRYTAEIISEGRDWLTNALVVSPISGSEETTFSILVTVADQIDYENDNWRNPVQFTVRIIETEDPTHVAEALITLTVEDVNDCDPEFQNVEDDGDILFNVPENVASGALIGTILATDADISPEFGNASIRYSWYKTIPTQLRLDNITGEVTVIMDNAFDYERLDELLFYVRASDMEDGAGTRQSTVILRVAVEDVNDEAPIVNLPSREAKIDENNATVIVAENIEISDPDTDASLTVSISSSSSNGADVSNWFDFVEVQEAGQPMVINIIIGEGLPDYEITQRVDVAITVVDENTLAGFQRETTVVLSVLLNNLNDETPQLEPPRNLRVTETDELCEIEEECESESLRYIYLFRATDADFPVEPLIFTLSSNVSAMEGLVSLNETTGVLSRAYGVDIDRDISYVDGSTEDFTNYLYYVIKVSDGENWQETEIRIPVEDLNDNIPQWTFDNSSAYQVSEDVGPGFSVVTVSATDRDAGNFAKLSYFIDVEYNGGIGADKFAMDQVTGELTVNATLDREAEGGSRYELQVQVKDNYRPGTSTNSNVNTILITIQILDVNDNSPVFSDPVFNDKYENAAEPGTVLGTVKVTDADEADNGVVTVSILNVTCTNCNSNPDPMLHFDGEFYTDNNTFIIKSTKSFVGWFGIFNITLYAEDKGTEPKSETQSFELRIIDVNDNAPVMVYPEPDLTFYINETLGIGQILVQWDGTPISALSATDDDDPESDNGKFVFLLDNFPEDGNDAASYFEVGLNNFIYVRQALEIDRNPYNLIVTVNDLGDPMRNDSESFTITVVPTTNAPPVFEQNEITLTFIENDASLSHQFPKATDADIIDDGAVNVFNQTICYYIFRTSEDEEPFLLDVDSNELTLSRFLDREEISEYNFVVHALNTLVNSCQPPTNPDLESPSNIKVRIIVDDVKDTAPKWPSELGSVISGGVRTDTRQGETTSVILRATDADLNETLTYSLGALVDHSDSSLDPITQPFELNTDNEIVIRFEPQATMKGFFNFSVFVNDSVDMSAEIQCKIYMVNQDNVVLFRFNNYYTEFDAEKSAALASVLTRVFSAYEPDFRCNIDDVQPSVDGNGVPMEMKTTVETHFIDSAKNEPVLRSYIENLQFGEPDISKNLTEELKSIDLSLDLYTYDQESSDNSDILTYVLIAGVGVLAILLLVISATCWFNNKSLSRRVRALTATTFGSHQSGLNKVGADLSLPNTNQHAIQGSNPIYSKEAEARARGIPDFDAESVGSGGSVLIGVEDEDDFRNYHQDNPSQNDNFQFGSPPTGNSNPLFEGGDEDFDYLDTQSQDYSENEFGQQEQELPRSNANVTRRNPLVQMESFDA